MNRTILAALGVAFVMLFMDATPALATHSGYHRVINRDWTDVCLEVDNAVPWDRANVTVDRCVGGVHQNWRLVPIGGGFYEVRVQHTEKCMEVRNFSHADGAQIQQYPCLNQPNQHWRLVDVGGGYFEIVARHSGKCLDKNWWNVVQWNCHGAPWQQWRFA
jgi:hypothetical protein